MKSKLLSALGNQELMGKIEGMPPEQCMYGVPNDPIITPAKGIETILILILGVVGVVTLILKRKSSWKIKAIIIILTLIGIFIVSQINWTKLFDGNLLI